MWLSVGIAAFGGVVAAFLLAKGASSNLHGSQALAYGLIFLLLGLLGVGYLLLFFAKYRLLVGPDRFGYQDFLGRQHVWYASETHDVVDATVVYDKTTRARRAIYFIGLDGRSMWAVNPGPWSDDAIGRLTTAAGKPVKVIATPISLAAFRQQYPQATGWIGRHTKLTGALLAIGLIVLALGIPIATIWIHW
jgi:hypothetical protein